MTDSELDLIALRFQVRGDWRGYARVVEARARSEALRDLQEYRRRPFEVRNGTPTPGRNRRIAA